MLAVQDLVQPGTEEVALLRNARFWLHESPEIERISSIIGDFITQQVQIKLLISACYPFTGTTDYSDRIFCKASRQFKL